MRSCVDVALRSITEPGKSARHRLKAAVLVGVSGVLAACGSPGPSTGASTSGISSSGATSSVAPYVLDGVLHDGTATVKLPTAEVVRFAMLKGGGAILAIRGGQTPNTSLIIDGQGHIQRTLLNVGWVVASDRSQILTGDGEQVAVLDTTGQEVVTRADNRYPVALVGSVAYTADDMYTDSSRPSIAWDTRDGHIRQLPPKLSFVSANGRVAVTVTPDGLSGSRCHQVYSLTATQVQSVRKSCGRHDGVAFVPESASPDGTLLVGHDDAIQSAAPVVVVVRAADGAVVLGSREDDSEIHGWGAALGAGNDVVVSRSSPDGNRLESCNPQGSCTPLTPKLPNDIGEPRYVLSEQ